MTRIAIIGAGRIGAVHARAVHAHPQAELTLVCDPLEANAKALGEAHGAAWCLDASDVFTSDDVDGALRALTPGGKESAVGADWLEGQKLISARVSRDGARVAVISERAGIVQIDVAGIIRDASNAPQGLSIRTPVGASIIAAKELVWVDEVTLAVLGASSEVSPTTVHLVPVGAHSFPLTAVDGAVSVAAGRGERTLYVRTKSDDLWSSSSTGTNWSLVASDVEVFSFPG